MFDKIVVAIDNTPDRARSVVATAAELAAALGSEVLVVHVRELERSASMLGTARPGAVPPSLHIESESESRELVDGAIEHLRGAGVRAEGLVHPGSAEGSTARELVNIADSFGATLVVVGDRGARVSDVLLGGVAHKIIQLASCPVLTVR